MSPSELDTKAPSVPPHPFKVGDRVRLKGPRAGGGVAGTVTDASWQTIGFKVLWDDNRASKHLGSELEPLNDAVNHPNHYTAGTLETIDAIEAMVGQAGWSPATGYRLGNVLKYLWRHAHKGGLESLKKARWYLDREIAAAEKAVEKAQEKKP